MYKNLNSKDRNPLFIAQIRVKKIPIRIRAIRVHKKIIHEKFVINYMIIRVKEKSITKNQYFYV